MRAARVQPDAGADAIEAEARSLVDGEYGLRGGRLEHAEAGVLGWDERGVQVAKVQAAAGASRTGQRDPGHRGG